MSFEAQWERMATFDVAVVAALGTTGNIMHCLEVLGDLAGVHATTADSVLIRECLSENCIWTDGVIPCKEIW
jgi:hypothetical protein